MVPFPPFFAELELEELEPEEPEPAEPELEDPELEDPELDPVSAAATACSTAVPIGEPKPVQASHPGHAENAPLLPCVMS